jgi:hypothetical protein
MLIHILSQKKEFIVVIYADNFVFAILYLLFRRARVIKSKPKLPTDVDQVFG